VILQRLTNALRRQDWVSVAIEISIVVLGVFIGLQVNLWAEERNLESRRLRTLDLLQQEATANLVELDERITSDEKKLSGLALMADTVTAGELRDRDTAAFERALAQTMYFASVNVQSGMYRALEQSGDLAALEDISLTSQLNNFNANLAWTENQWRSFRSGLSEFAPYWRPYVEHHRDPESGDRYVTWDLEGIRGDLQARSALMEVERMHAIFARYIVAIRRQQLEICTALAQRTGKPCEA
jgi:hypothetical protein